MQPGPSLHSWLLPCAPCTAQLAGVPWFCRGAGEIKLHPWFRGLDWTSLARTKAAFVPACDDELDTSYFHPKTVSVSWPPRRLTWRYNMLQQLDLQCECDSAALCVSPWA